MKSLCAPVTLATFALVLSLANCKRSRKLEDSGCGSSAYHYEFTECDATGGRWRVAIPSKGCEGIPPIPPLRLDECYKSCEAGQFLNITSMKCEECEPGTYSMGGGIRYDEWDPLPSGFGTSVEKFHSIFSPISRQYSSVNCTKWGWRARGDVLLSQGGPCVATLTLSTELVKSGNIKFTYQYPDDSLLFQFQANSDKCESAEGSRWPALTGEGIWRTEEVPLRRGLNTIKFLTMGIDDHKPKPILIRKIEIEGIGYASSCNACPPGTKSSRNANECDKCPRNTFSLHKSNICSPCQSNYYSEPGSRNCTAKPPCGVGDYYQVHSPCDRNNKTRIKYEWIQPKICLDDHADAVQLPLPGQSEECPPCNPGTEYRDKGCQPCPSGSYSDGLSPCTRCPSMTIPDTSHHLLQWYSWPYNVHITCISPEDRGCNQSPAWQLNSNYVSNGKGHADWVYLVMTLSIGGFRSVGGVINGEPLEVGRLTFSFETKCPQDCELLLMQSTSTKNATVVQQWIGSNVFQEVTHIVLRNDSYNFSWAFQKVAWESTSNIDEKNSWSDSFWPRQPLEEETFVKIYSINVTNTIDGGASSCIECQDGLSLMDFNKNKGSCPTCRPGHFRTTIPAKPRDANGTSTSTEAPIVKCEKCPEGTITLSSFATNASACKPCGPGLISKDGLTCTTNCLLKLGGYSYDLTPLQGFHMVRGSSLFTASGTQYYHVYNVSFCANGNARCDKNVSLPHGYDTQQNPTVEALVCQSTIFPATSSLNMEMNSNDEYPVSSPKPLSTHAGSLGDHLVGISHSPSILGTDVAHALDNKMQHPHQFHFFYSTPDPTPACSNGRSTVITFRCRMPTASWTVDHSSSFGAQIDEIKIPQKCPDATCDGCNYQFLWETVYACHLCSYDELTIVRGECKNGLQEIHYLNSANSMCLLKFNESWPMTQNCENHLPLIAEVAIQGAVGLTSLLTLLLICFWRRHRKLEYKYMKLVASGVNSNPGYSAASGESSHNENNLLPAPETCGIDSAEDDDEDEEHYSYNGRADANMSGQMREVGFYSEGGLKGFVSKFSVFNKLKSMSRKTNETGNNMEIMNLTDKEAVS